MEQRFFKKSCFMDDSYISQHGFVKGSVLNVFTTLCKCFKTVTAVYS